MAASDGSFDAASGCVVGNGNSFRRGAQCDRLSPPPLSLLPRVMSIPCSFVIFPDGESERTIGAKGPPHCIPIDRTSVDMLRRMDTANGGGQRIILGFGTLWSIHDFLKVLMFKRLDCGQEPNRVL